MLPTSNLMLPQCFMPRCCPRFNNPTKKLKMGRHAGLPLHYNHFGCVGADLCVCPVINVN
jgi:hypothetical protein